MRRCANCCNQIKKQSFYVVGTHQFVCSRECYLEMLDNQHVTETLGKIEERKDGESDPS